MNYKSSAVQTGFLMIVVFLIVGAFAYFNNAKKTPEETGMRQVGRVINDQATVDLWEIKVSGKWCLVSVTSQKSVGPYNPLRGADVDLECAGQ